MLSKKTKQKRKIIVTLVALRLHKQRYFHAFLWLIFFELLFNAVIEFVPFFLCARQKFQFISHQAKLQRQTVFQLVALSQFHLIRNFLNGSKAVHSEQVKLNKPITLKNSHGVVLGFFLNSEMVALNGANICCIKFSL